MEIENKLVVITGASRGIGAATARAFAARGAEVILLARTAKDLDALAEEIGERAHWYAVDLADRDATISVCEQIIDTHGDPDVVVNNAGMGRWLFVEETLPGEEEMMIKLPYLAAFNVTRAFLPGMLTRGSGRIVNVNSPAALMPWGGAVAYASSRWALRGFSEALKVDLHGTGVGVSHCVFAEITSSYFETNKGSHERLPGISRLVPVKSPEYAAKCIVKAVRRNKSEMTRPFMLWLFRINLALTPWLVKWLIRKTSYKRG